MSKAEEIFNSLSDSPKSAASNLRDYAVDMEHEISDLRAQLAAAHTAWKRAGYDAIFATPERAFDNQDALYTRPIPPADVADDRDCMAAIRTAALPVAGEKGEGK